MSSNYTHIVDLAKEVEPPEDGILTRTLFNDDDVKAVMMFSIFATLTLWRINPHKWLSWYFERCVENEGKAPDDSASFLPWNLSPDRLADL